jgi:hypothetical protein
VKAVRCQFIRRNVIPHRPHLGGFLDQVSNEIEHVVLSVANMTSSVQQGRQLAIIVTTRHGHERCQDGDEPLLGVDSHIADFLQLRQMSADLSLMPRHDNRLDICEVLVERRTPDSGFRRDLRHGHRGKTVCRHQRPGSIKDRIVDGSPVGFDRFAPQLGHKTIVMASWTNRHLSRHTVSIPRIRRCHAQETAVNNQPDPADNQGGTPRWVKVTAIVAVAAVLVLVIVAVLGGGDHGPGRHDNAFGSPALTQLA